MPTWAIVLIIVIVVIIAAFVALGIYGIWIIANGEKVE